MNRYKLNIIMIFMLPTWLLGVLCPGCSSGEYSRELLAIDSLLQTDPDSAWQRLCEYDTSLLISDNDTHYYALLSAEAYHKTYRDDIPEDAISEAAEYFTDKKDKRKAVRSMFYKGISYQNSGKYGPAIITQLKGIEMSDTSDHLYRGKIYNALREIYKGVSDAPQELDYARRSLEEYRKLDSLVFIEDLKIACGYALCRNNKIDEGIKEIQEVYKAASARHDEEMTEESLKYMALGYMWGGDDERAKDCFTILFSTEESFSRLKEYLYFYLDSMILSSASPDSVNTILKSITIDSGEKELPFRYYSYNNDYKSAYTALLEETQQSESLFTDRLRSSASHEVKEYMDKEQNKAKLRILHLNTIIIWVIVSLILLISLIFMFGVAYTNSKKKKEKDLLYSLEILTKEKVEIIKRLEKLNFDNKNLSDEYNILKKEYTEYRDKRIHEKDDKNKHESDLLLKLLDELDSLHADYYLHGATDKGKAIILNHLSDQLTLLRENKEILLSMEGFINNVYEKVLYDAYQVAKLNSDQRRIVALLILGFSKEAICQIMGVEISSFYTRMNRLVKKIEGCESPRKNELLELIGRKKG